MAEVSLVRLYVMRAGYLLWGVLLGAMIWPRLIEHDPSWPLMNSVVASLLGALAALAILGVRYPLQMIPLLLFELLWKSVWLVAVALPLQLSGQLDAARQETAMECLMGVVIFPFIIPWPYVFAHYARKPGDRWKAKSARTPSEAH